MAKVSTHIRRARSHLQAAQEEIKTDRMSPMAGTFHNLLGRVEGVLTELQALAEAKWDQ